MGQSQSLNVTGRPSKGIKAHMETAEKTGALVLADRKLHEIPNLSSLERVLRTLDLSSNRFIALPGSLALLANLKHLSVNNNRLESLDEDLGNLSKLESLSLMNNLLTTIPLTFSQLNHLKSLILCNNQLVEFPIAACGLPHLDILNISENKIEVIPDEVETLQAVELNANQNQISVISAAISQCPRLKTLRLEENSLEMSGIPDELLKDSQVSLICFNGNLFNMKELEERDGYDVYMERYTAVKKKMF